MRQLSQRDLDRKGLTVSSSQGHLSIEKVLSGGREVDVTVYTAGNIRMAPDPGWSYNPGQVDWKPDLSRYDADIRRLA